MTVDGVDLPAGAVLLLLGAPLARLEATVALGEIARTLVAPELDERSLVYKPNVNLRGPERMIIRFDGIRDLA